MKNLQKSLLISMTVIGMSGASLLAHAQKDVAAQPPVQKMEGEHKHHHEGKSPEQRRERVAKRQAALHDKLKLSAGQEAAWKTYVAAVTPSDKGKRPDHAEWAKLPAPERADRMLAKMKEREARMMAHVAAMKTFYATLTPEQQKIFDAESMHTGKHHRRGHDGHMGH